MAQAWRRFSTSASLVGGCFLALAMCQSSFAQNGPPKSQPKSGGGRPAGGAVRPAGGAPVRPAAPAKSSADSGGVQVALIDIAKCFKNHPGFNRQLEAVKADVASFDKEMAAKRNQVTSQQSQLADFAVGSPEYKKTDAAITKQVSDMQVSAQLKKKDLLLEEARIYYNAYNEIMAEVEAAALRYNINLVLRFDSSAIDPHDRNSVLQGVNRPVVHQKGLDITGIVLEALAAKYERVSARP
jgi:Skp family chaperone for outer membrane proteins